MNTMHIKKGDQVKIMRGKDRGKAGSVMKIFADLQKISIEGINLYKKRVKPRQQGKKGETVLVARPLAISNVMLVCKNCKKPVRVGYRMEGQKKARYCRKCQGPF